MAFVGEGTVETILIVCAGNHKHVYLIPITVWPTVHLKGPTVIAIATYSSKQAKLLLSQLLYYLIHETHSPLQPLNRPRIDWKQRQKHPHGNALFRELTSFSTNPNSFCAEFVLQTSVILPPESSIQQWRHSLIPSFDPSQQGWQENCRLCWRHCCSRSRLRHHAYPSRAPSGSRCCPSSSLHLSPSSTAAKWP